MTYLIVSALVGTLAALMANVVANWISGWLTSKGVDPTRSGRKFLLVFFASLLALIGITVLQIDPTLYQSATTGVSQLLNTQIPLGFLLLASIAVLAILVTAWFQDRSELLRRLGAIQEDLNKTRTELDFHRTGQRSSPIIVRQHT